jgi:hypothetical protein
MPLNNGDGGSLFEERTRYPQFGAQPAAQQERLQFGPLLAEGAKELQLLSPSEQSPNFVQQPTSPSGVLDGFVKTCQRWGLAERQQLVLLGYGDNEFLGLQLLKGRWLRVSQDVKDRAGYVLGISIGLGSIFNEVLEAEVSWLKTSHPKLGGEAPLDYMLKGRMVSLMRVSNLVAEERALM